MTFLIPLTRLIGLWGVLVVAFAGCGAITPLDLTVPGPRPRPQPSSEVCNLLDDDLNGEVDESFRDDEGRYLDSEHCGRCNNPCLPFNTNELATQCDVIEGRPVCAATQCATGFAVSKSGRCVPAFSHLCLTCSQDSDCGDLATAACVFVGSESRCTVGCGEGCPDGFSCTDDQCVPTGGSCSCEVGQSFDLACAVLDPGGNRCVGATRCDNGVLAPCALDEEICDLLDNDCDGEIDEDFRNAQGGYNAEEHCGQCGVDCATAGSGVVALVCGGEVLSPTCGVTCADLDDGLQVGDQLDADREIANGCECTVQATTDGIATTAGSNIDENCDGADGDSALHWYVALDGDDNAVGSPSQPLRTIGEAITRFEATVAGDAGDGGGGDGGGMGRSGILVAAGTYVESIRIESAAVVQGGYRRDFREWNPTQHVTEVRAPQDTVAPGGAALVVVQSGPVIRGIQFVGRDAVAAGVPTMGAYAQDPEAGFSLLDSTVTAGRVKRGNSGSHGTAGASPQVGSASGQPPRASVENGAHQCVVGAANQVAGGTGGINLCTVVTGPGSTDTVATHGGNGGVSGCPSFASFQAAGAVGLGTLSTPGGFGGTGGQDSQGPVVGSSCSTAVCCGLADFVVPTAFVGPEAGQNGQAGVDGVPGAACADPLGTFLGTTWIGATAGAGSAGAPGSGGGGGGAGGGSEMRWFPGACEHVDGLGGGGGGGGAGGCGGLAGTPGQSAAPTLAFWLRYTAGVTAVPTLNAVTLVTSDGAEGGAGGAGGDGGTGGAGGLGGELPQSARTTPTLAGPFAGGRGGTGGSGGRGGAGGGGCGGSVAGIWVTGGSLTTAEENALQSSTTFDLGQAGTGGAGGQGGVAAPKGTDGERRHVVTQ